MSNFEQWLCSQLTSLKVDTDVFTSYIQGILEGDESHEEKFEAIEGILSDTCPDTSIVTSKTNEILNKFAQTSNEGGFHLEQPVTAAVGTGAAFDDQVKSLFSLQTARAAESAGKKKVGSTADDAEVKQLKSSILNQYGHVEVEVDDDVDPSGDAVIKTGDLKDQASGKKTDPGKRKGPGAREDPLLMKNTNAQAVLEAEKLKREKSKQESDAKKAKDKLDRETQKKREIERKEKEKQRTQKGERRR